MSLSRTRERDWLATDTGRELAAAIGASVRHEVLAALGPDAADASRIAKLIVERRDLIEQWRDTLACLSQVANDPATPQLALWNLGRQALTRDRWGTGEAYVAIVVLEGMARQLGATVDGPRFRRGVDRERLAGYAKLLAATSAAKLRSAATALWVELYGEPATTIVDAAPRSVIASAR